MTLGVETAEQSPKPQKWRCFQRKLMDTYSYRDFRGSQRVAWFWIGAEDRVDEGMGFVCLNPSYGLQKSPGRFAGAHC